MYRVRLVGNAWQNSVQCVACRASWIRQISQHSTKRSNWTSHKVRSTFLEFFKQNDHIIVPSSSVIPHKNEGSYFVNAGMNQFKPIFLGTADPSSVLASYRRVANTQKCIRISGKHNDLMDVGRDFYHHTFFEMLGSWSFGDYFKMKACSMAWQLLTDVYGLPASQLYVTYFAGSEKDGIPPDTECRDIWLEIGVPANRVIACGMKDNFWSMGETGPCGPCTEIHFDHTASADAAHLVNTGDDNVIELWNVVFMQFDRQADGSLRKLPMSHVDTGMGLERLCAVLQGSKSNYDTDLFSDLFSAIQKGCKSAQYTGTLPDDLRSGSTDTAYRIVADHARMFTVAIADGLMPGRRESECKLRQVIYRCVHNAQEVLHAERGFVASLVPVVAENLGDTFPEISRNANQIQQIVSETEERYFASLDLGQKVLMKALKKYGKIETLSEKQLYEMQSGQFGNPVSAEIVCTLAERMGISVDLDQFEDYMKSIQATNGNHVLGKINENLNQFHVELLKKLSIPPTDDSSKYSYCSTAEGYYFPPLRARVVALLEADKLVDAVHGGSRFDVVLDRTCFYAEAGGQAADSGTIATEEGCSLRITDVQSIQQYVFHKSKLAHGSLRVGDDVTLSIDSEHRTRCMANHTATHLCSAALNTVLGNVQQLGSMVTDSKLIFDFSCNRLSVSSADLIKVSEIMDQAISKSIPVHRVTLPLSDTSSIRNLKKFSDQYYPSVVHAISFGVPAHQLLKPSESESQPHHSVELCGGTHLENLSHIESVVVTQFQGSTQGTKRIVAVTREAAKKALYNTKVLRETLKTLSQGISSNKLTNEQLELARTIETDIARLPLLPKVEREELQSKFELLANQKGINVAKNEVKAESLKQSIQKMLTQYTARDGSSAFVAKVQFDTAREVVSVIADISPSIPVCVAGVPPGKDTAVGVMYVPRNDEKETTSLACDEWAELVCIRLGGSHSHPKGKLSKHSNISVFSIPSHNNENILDEIIVEATACAKSKPSASRVDIKQKS